MVVMSMNKMSSAWSFLFVCLGVTATVAADNVHDYYGALTPQEEQLLKDNERVHLGKAISDLRSGKPHRLRYAEAEFKYILAIWPNHPASLEGIAEIARKTGRYQLAEEYFQRAIRYFPGQSQTHALYGVYLYRIRQYERAVEQLEIAVSLDPQQSQNHYFLGLAYFAKGDYEESARHARKAYSLGYPLPGLRNKLRRKGFWNEKSPVDAS